ncbi:hypothetical protein HMPREF0971_03163 [Segatella oris F0302]|uniref:Uncharacterized protein n=1 Tax=Segatella oris F0302 TaxID=649760 RepID=D1QVX2_9BACT|nr:hypothetical protein HMPREF0971_03163 [Segatella oris F0302]
MPRFKSVFHSLLPAICVTFPRQMRQTVSLSASFQAVICIKLQADLT